MEKPTLFDTLIVAPDDPIRQRPPTPLPMEASVEAVRLISAFPGVPELQAFGPAAVCFRLTMAEFQEIQRLARSAAEKN